MLSNVKKSGIVFTAFITAALFIISFSSFGATGQISFSDPVTEVGSEVNVKMKISLDANAVASSANIVLQYPSEKLEFLEGTDSSGGAGSVRVHGISNGGRSSLVEYNLKFRAIQAGVHSLDVKTYEVYDAAEKVISITHVGSSKITVNASPNASANASLNFLEVYPGQLEPDFSADTLSYNVSVGINVEKLTINAIPADASSSVLINGNDALVPGLNEIEISVTAADGKTTKQYVLEVNKVDGGPDESEHDAGIGEMPEGVQLSSRGKTITIMNPGDDVSIPENFRSGIINIDNKKVKGWINGSDESPEYFIVYGMNDKGELNFYRYDMAENEMTIQRYFEDPVAASAVSGSEYDKLKTDYEEMTHTSEFRLLLLLICAVIAVILLIILIFVGLKLAANSKELKKLKEINELNSERSKSITDVIPGQGVLKHEINGAEFSTDQSENEETQVIRRVSRRRPARRPVGENRTTDDIDILDQ